MFTFLHKHAVWCQCATVFHISITLACIASFQEITLHSDIFWSVVCIINTTILFAESEHAPIASINTDTWQTVNKYREQLIWSLIGTFYWRMGTFFIYQIALVVLLFVIQYKLSRQLTTIIFGISCFWDSLVVKAIFTLYIFAIYKKERQFRAAVTQSITSPTLKSAYAWKALGIVLEGVLLWHIRCLHRFPHTFRWKNVFIALTGVTAAIIYSEFRVSKTRVSRNAIIQKYGHGMAASLTAAKDCPVCSRCLTALDMESSFDEGL